MRIHHGLVTREHLTAILMAVVAGITLFFGHANEARAEEGWHLTSGANFMYFNEVLMSSEYRDGNTFYGGTVSVQPEYRFKNWFGLGLDVGLGGLVARDASANWSVPHHSEAFYFQSIITCKFIATLNIVELWGEIGAGFMIMAGNLINEEGMITDEPDWGFPIRVRAGVTFDINDTIGIGLHGAFGMMIFAADTVEAGIHFTKRF